MNNSKNFHPQFSLRVIALFILIAFITTDIFSLPVFAVPEEAQGSEKEAGREVLPVLFPTRSLSKIEVPSGVGKIQEIYQAAGSKPAVILIQDAHAIASAQRNIQKLIGHFQKQYGVNLVAIEGASSKLDPQIFKSFPDKELLEKTFEEYFDNGELTGSAAAAIFDKGHADYYGIEDWTLYEEGVGLYLKAAEKEEEFKDKLQSESDRLQAEKEKTYSRKLLVADEILRQFHENEIDLVTVLKKLDRIQKGTGKNSLPVPFVIKALLGEIKKDGVQYEGVEKEVKGIADRIQKVSDTFSVPDTIAFHQKYQAFQTSQINAAEFGLFMKEFLEKKTGHHSWPVPFSEKLLQQMQRHKRLRDIEGTQFFKDFETYAQSVKELLFRNDSERELDKKSRHLELLEKLVSLELSREEWEEIREAFVVKHEANFKHHVAFYRNAEKRDTVLFTNWIKLIERRGQAHPFASLKSRVSDTVSDTAALLVAGGFHTEGLARQFKENGISYVVVRPEIDTLTGESRYRQHMQGHVSWENYFREDNGKMSPYEAFVRGARDRLLGVRTSSFVNRTSQAGNPLDDVRNTMDNVRLLKSWRDQILRDLSQKKQLAKAHEYTRFLDEIAPPDTTHATHFIRHEIREKWLTNINRFIESLKQLRSANQLTERNVSKLLQSFSAADPYTSNALNPDAWLSRPPLTRSEMRNSVSRREILTLASLGAAEIIFRNSKVLLAQEKETGKVMLFFVRHLDEEDFNHVKPHLKEALDELLKQGKTVHYFIEGPETAIEFVTEYVLYEALNPANKGNLADIFGKDLYQGTLPAVFFDWVFNGRPAADIPPSAGAIRAFVKDAERPQQFDPQRWNRDRAQALKVLDQIEKVYDLYLKILAGKMPPGSKSSLKDARQRIQQVFEEYIDALDRAYNNNQWLPFPHRFIWKLRSAPDFFEAQSLFLRTTYAKHMEKQYKKQFGKSLLIHHERSLLPEDLFEYSVNSRLYALELPEGFPLDSRIFAEADRIFEWEGFNRTRHLPSVFFGDEGDAIVKKIERERMFSGSVLRKDSLDERIDQVVDYWAELYRRSYHSWAVKRDKTLSGYIGSVLKKPEDAVLVSRGAHHKEDLSALMATQQGKGSTLVKDLDWKQKDDEEQEDLSLSLKEERALYGAGRPTAVFVQKGEGAISRGLIRYLIKTLELYWAPGEENKPSPLPQFLEGFSAKVSKNPGLERAFLKEALRVYEAHQKQMTAVFGKDKPYRAIEYAGELYAVAKALKKTGVPAGPESKWLEERIARYESQLIRIYAKEEEKIRDFLKGRRSEVRAGYWPVELEEGESFVIEEKSRGQTDRIQVRFGGVGYESKWGGPGGILYFTAPHSIFVRRPPAWDNLKIVLRDKKGFWDEQAIRLEQSKIVRDASEARRFPLGSGKLVIVFNTRSKMIYRVKIQEVNLQTKKAVIAVHTVKRLPKDIRINVSIRDLKASKPSREERPGFENLLSSVDNELDRARNQLNGMKQNGHVDLLKTLQESLEYAKELAAHKDFVSFMRIISAIENRLPAAPLFYFAGKLLRDLSKEAGKKGDAPRSEMRATVEEQIPSRQWKGMVEEVKQTLRNLEYFGLGRDLLTVFLKEKVQEKIIRAFETVPRDEFVPPGLRDRAFENVILPLGDGPHTLSEYKVVAEMLALAGPNLLDDGPILEIGSGSGYVAALLSKINEAAQVYGLEMNPDLVESSTRILRGDLKIQNVHIEPGNGTEGLKEHGPYALILVSAGATHIPQVLVDQLKPRGVLVIPFLGQLVRFIKTEKGELIRQVTLSGPYRFVSFQGAADEEILEKALKAGTVWLIWKQTRNAQTPDYFSEKANLYGLNLPEPFWKDLKQLSEGEQHNRFGEELERALLSGPRKPQSSSRSEIRTNPFAGLISQGELRFKPAMDPQDFAWKLNLILQSVDRVAKDPIEKYDEDAFDLVYQEAGDLIKEYFDHQSFLLILDTLYEHQAGQTALYLSLKSPAWYFANALHEFAAAFRPRAEIRTAERGQALDPERERDLWEGIPSERIKQFIEQIRERIGKHLSLFVLSPEYARWFLDEIIALKFKPSLEILSLGAGQGHLEEALQRMGHKVTALELDPEFVKILRKKKLHGVFEGDLHHLDKLDIPSHAFDLVILPEVLNMAGLRTAESLKRYLKPSGRLLITEYKYNRKIESDLRNKGFPTVRIRVPEIKKGLNRYGFELQEYIQSPSFSFERNGQIERRRMIVYIAKLKKENAEMLSESGRSELRAEPVRILLADKPASEQTVEAIRKLLADSFSGEAELIEFIGSFSEKVEVIEAIGVGKDKDLLKRVLEEKRPAVVVVRSDTKAFQGKSFMRFAQKSGVRAVIRMGAGVDNINQEAATEEQISLIRTHGNANSVANLALRFLLAGLSVPLDRPGSSDLSQDLEWGKIFDISLDEFNKAEEKSHKAGRGMTLSIHKKHIFRPISPEQAVSVLKQLQGKTIGLVGFGPIAQALAEKLNKIKELTGISFTIAATSPALDRGDPDRVRIADPLGVLHPGEDAVLKSSDILSLHLAGEAKNYFTLEKLVQARKAKLIINTARQDIVDSEALKAFLTRPGLYFADIDLAKDGQPLTEIVDILSDHPTLFYALPHIAASTGNAAAGVEANTLTVLETTLNQLLEKDSPSGTDLDIVNRVPLSRTDRLNQKIDALLSQGVTGGQVSDEDLRNFLFFDPAEGRARSLNLTAEDGTVFQFKISNWDPGVHGAEYNPENPRYRHKEKAEDHVFKLVISARDITHNKPAGFFHLVRDESDPQWPQFYAHVGHHSPMVGDEVIAVYVPQEYGERDIGWNLGALALYFGYVNGYSNLRAVNVSSTPYWTKLGFSEKGEHSGYNRGFEYSKNALPSMHSLARSVLEIDEKDLDPRVDRLELLEDGTSDLRKDLQAYMEEKGMIEWGNGGKGLLTHGRRDHDLEVVASPELLSQVPAIAKETLRSANDQYSLGGFHIYFLRDKENNPAILIHWIWADKNTQGLSSLEQDRIEGWEKAGIRKIVEWAESRHVLIYAGTAKTANLYGYDDKKMNQKRQEFFDPEKWRETPLMISAGGFPKRWLRFYSYRGNSEIVRRRSPPSRSELRKESESQIAALADDPTGRNEIEAGLRLQGFQVEGISAAEDLEHLLPDHAAVVNLGTRHLEPDEIADHLNKYWSQASFYKQPALDLKIDSKMRGPVGALIREVAKRHKSDLILFTPVNPRQGQEVVNGELFVTENGQKKPLHESEYWKEVVFDGPPASSLAEILRKQEAVPSDRIHTVNLDQIGKGADALRKLFLSFKPGSMVIFDSQSEEDLQTIVKAASGLGKRILRVGSAGLLNAAMAQRTPRNPIPEIDRNLALPFRPANKVPMVFLTTLNEATRRQIDIAQNFLGERVRMIEIDPVKITGESAQRSRETKRIQKLIQSNAANKKAIILATKTQFQGQKLSKTSLRRFQLLLARESAKILRDKEILASIKYLFVSGGDGVEALEEVFHTHADVRGLYAPDVPWGVLLSGPLKGIPIVTKSGGFGVNAPDLIARFLEEGMKSVLAISMGDPLGIGPEIAVRLFLEHPEILEQSNPFMIGNARIFEEALDFVRDTIQPDLDPEKKWQVRAFSDLSEIMIPKGRDGELLPVIPVLDIASPRFEKSGLRGKTAVYPSHVENEAARLVEEILDVASELARNGSIDALIRNPINKSRIDSARRARKDKNIFIGHTEYLAEHIGTSPALMALEKPDMRKELETTRMILTHASQVMGLRLSVIHASTVHQSLKDAVQEFTSKDPKVQHGTMIKTAEAILRAGRFAKLNQGISKPRIAVNDLTSQKTGKSQDSRRARRLLQKAIGLARKKDPDLLIVGPLPARESYIRALFGKADFVVALYHDQGHIPLKLASSLLDIHKKILSETQQQIYRNHKPIKWDARKNFYELGPLTVYLSSNAPLPEAVQSFQTRPSNGMSEQFQSPHQEQLFNTIEFARRDLKQKGIKNPRILVAAINPHAGEDGKFGSEDQTSSVPAIEKARSAFSNLTLEGPVPADAVFIKALMEKWDAIITVHLDQLETAAAVYEALKAEGLLRLKPTIAGVNVTEGLRNGFISTSVDHGTNERDAWNPDRSQPVIASSLYDAFLQGYDYAAIRNRMNAEGTRARSEVRGQMGEGNDIFMRVFSSLISRFFTANASRVDISYEEKEDLPYLRLVFSGYPDSGQDKKDHIRLPLFRDQSSRVSYESFIYGLKQMAGILPDSSLGSGEFHGSFAREFKGRPVFMHVVVTQMKKNMPKVQILAHFTEGRPNEESSRSEIRKQDLRVPFLEAGREVIRILAPAPIREKIKQPEGRILRKDMRHLLMTGRQQGWETVREILMSALDDYYEEERQKSQMIRDRVDQMLDKLILQIGNQPAYFVLDLPEEIDSNKLSYLLHEAFQKKSPVIRPILTSTSIRKGSQVMDHANDFLRREGLKALPDPGLKMSQILLGGNGHPKIGIMTLNQPHVSLERLPDGFIPIEHEEDGIVFDQLMPDEQVISIKFKMIQALALWLNQEPAELLREDPVLAGFIEDRFVAGNAVRLSLNHFRSEIRAREILGQAA